ncbi:hypothetical protein HDU76_010435 [Blyttiomyces sp. JEL0837]|nr:hypothetical protein HDU76_010435 [Blyttiomyces sp. JEL0837]
MGSNGMSRPPSLNYGRASRERAARMRKDGESSNVVERGPSTSGAGMGNQHSGIPASILSSSSSRSCWNHNAPPTAAAGIQTLVGSLLYRHAVSLNEFIREMVEKFWAISTADSTSPSLESRFLESRSEDAMVNVNSTNSSSATSSPRGPIMNDRYRLGVEGSLRKRGTVLSLVQLSSFALAASAPQKTDDGNSDDDWYSMIPSHLRSHIFLQHLLELCKSNISIIQILDSLIDSCVSAGAHYQAMDLMKHMWIQLASPVIAIYTSCHRRAVFMNRETTWIQHIVNTATTETFLDSAFQEFWTSCEPRHAVTLASRAVEMTASTYKSNDTLRIGGLFHGWLNGGKIKECLDSIRTRRFVEKCVKALLELCSTIPSVKIISTSRRMARKFYRTVDTLIALGELWLARHVLQWVIAGASVSDDCDDAFWDLDSAADDRFLGTVEWREGLPAKLAELEEDMKNPKYSLNRWRHEPLLDEWVLATPLRDPRDSRTHLKHEAAKLMGLAVANTLPRVSHDIDDLLINAEPAPTPLQQKSNQYTASGFVPSEASEPSSEPDYDEEVGSDDACLSDSDDIGATCRSISSNHKSNITKPDKARPNRFIDCGTSSNLVVDLTFERECSIDFSDDLHKNAVENAKTTNQPQSANHIDDIESKHRANASSPDLLIDCGSSFAPVGDSVQRPQLKRHSSTRSSFPLEAMRPSKRHNSESPAGRMAIKSRPSSKPPSANSSPSNAKQGHRQASCSPAGKPATRKHVPSPLTRRLEPVVTRSKVKNERSHENYTDAEVDTEEGEEEEETEEKGEESSDSGEDSNDNFSDGEEELPMARSYKQKTKKRQQQQQQPILERGGLKVFITKALPTTYECDDLGGL